MAAEIYKCRIFKVTGLDVIKENSYKLHHVISVSELDLAPFKKKLKERERELKTVVKAFPELSIGKIAAKIPVHEISFLGEEVMEEYNDESPLYMLVTVHKGRRGQYVTGWQTNPWLTKFEFGRIIDVELELDCNANKDVMRKVSNAEGTVWKGLCLVENILRKEGKLDERYKIQKD